MRLALAFLSGGVFVMAALWASEGDYLRALINLTFAVALAFFAIIRSRNDGI